MHVQQAIQAHSRTFAHQPGQSFPAVAGVDIALRRIDKEPVIEGDAHNVETPALDAAEVVGFDPDVLVLLKKFPGAGRADLSCESAADVPLRLVGSAQHIAFDQEPISEIYAAQADLPPALIHDFAI